MTIHRRNPPRPGQGLFLTDGGIETTLIFHEGVDLPYFASFDLLKSSEGVELLIRYFERYIAIARKHQAGFVLETPTWRASPDWGRRIGYSESQLAEANREAVALLAHLRNQHECEDSPMVISGNIGPRGDGYAPDEQMTVEEALCYHAVQVGTFAGTAVDMVSAFTINYVEEGIGIIEAARAAGVPVVISWTVETDGRLPTGESLAEAIERADSETDGYAAYYMINCAHPTHFERVIENGTGWAGRIGGVRANASCLSHAELDEAEELDEGNPVELGDQYLALFQKLPMLRVLGGCCGTDHRHIEAIAARCLTPISRAAV